MSSCVCSGRFRPYGTRLTLVLEQVREYKFKYVRLVQLLCSGAASSLRDTLRSVLEFCGTGSFAQRGVHYSTPIGDGVGVLPQAKQVKFFRRKEFVQMGPGGSKGLCRRVYVPPLNMDDYHFV
ncbi:hypothetical protein OB236_05100 [Paenibacillus sp. WQ 127069]|uniref:Uncharacterized protein n=1 Tax=Paenibacillus baimaensis TaxID=2982185 RepID=A0ABT2UA33_9BACL|nr:hypothetical protein [Paenibacillus sp. WQ 127069]MCU6791506.1 hypothetical protein [Paenibacillus sp. WQ 127069]